MSRSASGPIVAGVCANVGTFAFPDRGWSDFVVVVIGWWLDAVYGLDTVKTAELDYMDGPYCMRVSALGNGICSVQCVKMVNEQIQYEAHVEFAQLLSELRRVAAEVLETCRQRRWESDDTEVLRRLLNRS